MSAKDHPLAFLFFYALRHISRHKRRSALLILTVGFSVSVSLLSMRYARALLDFWGDAASDTGTADIEIVSAAADQSGAGLKESLFAMQDAALQSTLRDPAIQVKSPRLRFEGIVMSGSISTYFLGLGVKPQTELRLAPRLFVEGADRGHFIATSRGAVLTKSFATDLKVQLGDTITLLCPTADGSANAIDLIVTGIADIGLPNFSQRTIMVDLETAQKFLRAPLQISEYALRTKKQLGISDTRFKTRNRQEIDPLLYNIERIWAAVSGFIIALLLLLTSITIMNVIMLAVSERTVEIGTLMALGAKRRAVLTTVAMEGLIIGSAGATLGTFFSNGILYYFQKSGMDFASPFGSHVIKVYPSPNLEISLLLLCIAVFMCLISSVPAARTAANVEPVVAFRGQV